MASSSVLATQLTLGTIASGFLAYLKTAKWAPFINKHSAAINHTFLLVASAAGALGIHYTWDATNHSITITGITVAGVAHGIWEWTKQWSLQYLTQRGLYGPVSIPGDAPPILATPMATTEK